MESRSQEETRVYRPDILDRVLYVPAGCAVASIGGRLLEEAWRGTVARGDWAAIVFLGSWGLLAVIFGVLIVRCCWKRLLILASDAVAAEYFWGMRMLKFTDIRGRRKRRTKGGSCILIIPKSEASQEVSIDDCYVVDAFFWRWVDSLPDLDALDKEKRGAAGEAEWEW